jgi:hypothetical protein
MRYETRQFGSRLRTSIAALTLSGVMLASVGVAVDSGGASGMKLAGQSAYCKTLMSFSAIKGAPSTKNLVAYRNWISAALPKFQKLQSQAPNASVKRVLGDLVVVLKSQSNATGAAKLQRAIAANQKQWVNDWKVFTSSALSCVTSLY